MNGDLMGFRDGLECMYICNINKVYIQIIFVNLQLLNFTSTISFFDSNKISQ